MDLKGDIFKMAKAQIPGSIKRFGARYGKTIKSKVAFLEKEQRSLHKCPDCRAVSVRRMSAGIWQCRKCNKKFAGKAYMPGKKPRLIEAVTKEEIEEPKTEVKAGEEPKIEEKETIAEVSE